MTKDFQKSITKIDELNFGPRKRAKLVCLILRVFTAIKEKGK